MRMHVLSGGRLRMRRSIYVPQADPEQTIELPVSCVLLRHAQGNVLFDTGCHPSIAEDPVPRWGALAKALVPIMPPGDHVLTGLAAIGLAPDDIDVVVCSHLHTDHCGCNAFFTRATMVLHARELDAAQAPDAIKRGYVAADWAQPAPLRTIDAQTDLMGDGRIVLLPLPGHTPGQIGALVALDRSGAFLLASDALSVRENLDRDIIPRNTWDADACAASFAEIRRIEATGAQVICGHDAAQWDRLRKGADAYD